MNLIDNPGMITYKLPPGYYRGKTRGKYHQSTKNPSDDDIQLNIQCSTSTVVT